MASPKLVMEEAPDSYKVINLNQEYMYIIYNTMIVFILVFFISFQDVTEVVNTCHDAGISRKTIKLRPIAVIKG